MDAKVCWRILQIYFLIITLKGIFAIENSKKHGKNGMTHSFNVSELDNSFEFKVRGSANAYIELESTKCKTTYGIVLGCFANRLSAIIKNNEMVEAQLTNHILCPSEFRGFWITWIDGRLLVGHEGSKYAFLNKTFPETINVNLISASTNETDVDWIFKHEAQLPLAKPTSRSKKLRSRHITPHNERDLKFSQIPEIQKEPNDILTRNYQQKTAENYPAYAANLPDLQEFINYNLPFYYEILQYDDANFVDISGDPIREHEYENELIYSAQSANHPTIKNYEKVIAPWSKKNKKRGKKKRKRQHKNKNQTTYSPRNEQNLQKSPQPGILNLAVKIVKKPQKSEKAYEALEKYVKNLLTTPKIKVEKKHNEKCWTNANNASVPLNMISYGFDDHEELFICRARHKGILMPGSLSKLNNVCRIAAEDNTHTFTEYDAFTCVENFLMVPKEDEKNPMYQKVPVESSSNGQSIYICRAQSENKIWLGSVQGNLCAIPDLSYYHTTENYDIFVEAQESKS